MSDTTNKYLTFTLDDEFFAIDINSVREIQDVTDITRIPESQQYMRGVVNLRGSAVPVLDIKLKFGMKRTEHTINTRIIIMSLIRNDSEQPVGVLADSVKEVQEIEDKDIEAPPRMGTRIHVDYILGVAKKNDRFILLLDLLKLLDKEEVKESDTCPQPGEDKDAAAVPGCEHEPNAAEASATLPGQTQE